MKRILPIILVAGFTVTPDYVPGSQLYFFRSHSPEIHRGNHASCNKPYRAEKPEIHSADHASFNSPCRADQVEFDQVSRAVPVTSGNHGPDCWTVTASAGSQDQDSFHTFNPGNEIKSVDEGELNDKSERQDRNPAQATVAIISLMVAIVVFITNPGQ